MHLLYDQSQQCWLGDKSFPLLGTLREMIDVMSHSANKAAMKLRVDDTARWMSPQCYADRS